MSIAPIPAHQAVPKDKLPRISEDAAAAFGRMPVPAHKIVARNGVAVTSEQAAADPARYSTEAPQVGKPFSFWDMVDIVNPLQHIPVVNTIYRQLTGDEIGNFARIAGGGLYGGLVGAAIGGINATLVDNSGKDVGETMLAYFNGDDDKPATASSTETAIASKTDATAPAARTATTSSSQALFDGPAAAHGSSGKTVPAAPAVEPKPSVPVIEVRPNAMKEEKPSLPVSRDITNLAELEPGNPTPVQKDKVQQAMMDALLKMQESQNESTAALDASVDAKI